MDPGVSSATTNASYSLSAIAQPFLGLPRFFGTGSVSGLGIAMRFAGPFGFATMLAAASLAPASSTPFSSSPQTRARTAWIFFSKRSMSSRFASTSFCSTSISATMARWVGRGGLRWMKECPDLNSS
jgi:hypothetical protein